MNNYSNDVQKVISMCESLAFKFTHTLITSEHLLLSLIKNDNLLTRYLSKYKITFDSLYKRISNSYPRQDSEPMYMEYTIELRNVLNNASTCSKQYREESISLNSLILAVLITDNSAAYELLQKNKVNIDEINQNIQTQLSRKSELVNISDLHYLADIAKDPLIGRVSELNQLINALSRRNKPNAILVGEPGVGKTAIVEELSRLLKDNNVPSLRNKSIYELDLASTVGGTKYRGEFEEKIKRILKKVIEDGNCILFIDEIHNVIKAGGAEGAIDASNILKPYLSRGEIQIIGATTEDEFQNVFEKDKALKRRFQIIKVEETTVEETKNILYRINNIYQDYYKINISNQILDYIVERADEFLKTSFFPDKAIDILDNSCVISNGILTKSDVDKTIEMFYKITNNSVDKIEVVKKKINLNIAGQERAIDKIVNDLEYLCFAKQEKNKPLLSMMFLGPSGVGKSEIANIIGETYFGKENLIYLNMSSFQDSTALSKLIGVSYGYSGQEINPKLVRDLKAHPKSLIILDEIEKANNEVLDFFLQVMDLGFFESGKGERISCTNAMIIMTSNFGYDLEQRFTLNLRNKKDTYEETINKLQKRFRFEFLSRLDDVVVFDYLDRKQREEIAKKYISEYSSIGDAIDIGTILAKNEEEYQKYGARLVKKECKEAIKQTYLQKQQ